MAKMAELKLFPYQETVIPKMHEGFIIGHRMQMLYAPCGAGKTEIAIAIMDTAARNGKNCAMLLDLKILCSQTSTRISKYGIEHGVIKPDSEQWNIGAKIQVCMTQTLESYCNPDKKMNRAKQAREYMDSINVLVVDEAHLHRKYVTKFISEHPKVYVIGLSGSPFTKGLGAHYSNVVSFVTVNDLIEKKQLIYPKVFIATKVIDMTGAKKVGGEWSDAETSKRGIEITGDVVSEWRNKTFEVFGEPKKTIVFCAGMAHGADLQLKFNDAGFNFVSISHKDSPEYREQVIEEFSRPDSCIVGLIATDLLTKGFDVTDVCIMVSARPFSKSFSSHVQQLGRIMRKHGDDKEAIVLDHAGNFLRFRDQWDDLCANGVSKLDDGAEKTKPEPTDKEKEAAKCPKCGAVWPGKSDICAHCGMARVHRNDIVDVAGEMLELTSSPKDKKKEFSTEYKQDWYSQFLYLENTWKVKKYWAFAMFINKFGHKPMGYSQTIKPASGEVINYAKSRFMANNFAKGKEA
jgi:superfamily II DNA or RNA helicase